MTIEERIEALPADVVSRILIRIVATIEADSGDAERHVRDLLYAWSLIDDRRPACAEPLDSATVVPSTLEEGR